MDVVIAEPVYSALTPQLPGWKTMRQMYANSGESGRQSASQNSFGENQ